MTSFRAPWSIGRPAEVLDAQGITIAMVPFQGVDRIQERIELAQLIASAPALLEALQELLPMVAEWHAEFPRDVGDKEPTAIANARAAIAAATGEK